MANPKHFLDQAGLGTVVTAIGAKIDSKVAAVVTTTIDETSTDSLAASAKAVYNLVQSQVAVEPVALTTEEITAIIDAM